MYEVGDKVTLNKEMRDYPMYLIREWVRDDTVLTILEAYNDENSYIITDSYGFDKLDVERDCLVKVEEMIS